MSEWISVDERLPDAGERVLCYCRANIYEVMKMRTDGAWVHNDKVYDSTYMGGFVTHWMPLPAPPKEEHEYISREEAKAKIREKFKKLADRIEVNEVLNSIPAADVQPVRHGRWIKTIGENGVTSACRCNLCGFEDNRYSLFNYCPNCGAKMDGGGE